jgi:hypothetical protein
MISSVAWSENNWVKSFKGWINPLCVALPRIVCAYTQLIEPCRLQLPRSNLHGSTTADGRSGWHARSSSRVVEICGAFLCCPVNSDVHSFFMVSLSIYDLFNDAVSSSDYIAPKEGVINEWRIGKGIDGSDRGALGHSSWHLPGGTEEKQEKLSQDSRSPRKLHLPTTKQECWSFDRCHSRAQSHTVAEEVFNEQYVI